MSSLFLSIGGAQPNWMQHHMPWMAVLALIFGMASEAPISADEADLNG